MRAIATSIIGFAAAAAFMFPVWSQFSVAVETCTQEGTQFKDEALFCSVLSEYNRLNPTENN